MTMNKTLLSASIAAACAATVPAVLAQESGEMRDPGQIRLMSAEDFIDMEIETRDGKEAGEIESLLIAPATGEVRYVLLEEDGDLELEDDEYVALPFRALDLRRMDDDEIATNVSFSEIETAVRITEEGIGKLSDPQVMTAYYDHYSMSEQAEAGPDGSSPGADPRSSMFEGKRADGRGSRASTPSGSETDRAKSGAGDSKDGEDAPQLRVTRYAITTVVPGMTPADRLMGAEVHAASHDEELGEIDELVVDIDHGRVAYTLVSRGGFLGIGDEWMAVPLQGLAWNEDHEAYRVEVGPEGERGFSGLAKSDVPSRVSVSELDAFYRYYDMGSYLASPQQQGNAR